MYSGRLAAEVATEAIEKGDTSKGFLKLYYDRLEASPVGQQFVGGKQVRAMFDLLLAGQGARETAELMRFMMALVWGAWSGTMYPASVTVPLMIPAFMNHLPIMGKVLGLYLPLVSPALAEPLSRLANELAGGMMKGLIAKGGE